MKTFDEWLVAEGLFDFFSRVPLRDPPGLAPVAITGFPKLLNMGNEWWLQIKRAEVKGGKEADFLVAAVADPSLTVGSGAFDVKVRLVNGLPLLDGKMSVTPNEITVSGLYDAVGRYGKDRYTFLKWPKRYQKKLYDTEIIRPGSSTQYMYLRRAVIFVPKEALVQKANLAAQDAEYWNKMKTTGRQAVPGRQAQQQQQVPYAIPVKGPVSGNLPVARRLS